jgi:hypothetical protein
MDFDAFVRSLHLDPTALTPEQAAALESQWRASMRPANSTSAPNAGSDIAALLARYIREAPDRAEALRATAARAIEEGVSAADANLRLLRATYGNGPPAFSPSDGTQPASASVEAGLCMSLGLNDNRVAQLYGDRATQHARDRGFNRLGLHDLFKMQLRAAGYHCPAGRLSESDIVHALRLDARGFDARTVDAFGASMSGGPSTASVTGLLSNSANKLISSAFSGVATTWQKFAKVANLSDFKPATIYRLTGPELDYLPLSTGGEIKHGTLGEENTSVQLDTRARMLSLDRKQMLNDDLGAFNSIPMMLGRKGALLVDKLAYLAILANAGNFFSAANKNLAEAGSELSIAGLNMVEALFRTQRDAGGDPSLIEPAILLTPPALAATGRQLVANQPLTGGSTAGPSASPFAGMFEPVASPWLSEEIALHDDADDDAWYLFAAASDVAPVVLAFLDGRMMPTVEPGDVDFNRLGMVWRGYHDVGAALHEHRGGVRATGAPAS